MKTTVLLVWLASFAAPLAAGDLTSSPEIRQRDFLAQSVLDADYVTVGTYNTVTLQSTVSAPIRDRAWQSEIAKVLGKAFLTEQAPILAMASPTTFYDRNGAKVMEIEVFGTVLRINAHDYNAGKETCSALRKLLSFKEANQSKDPAA
ncbi:MAG TPA: hypothetical protein VFE25_16085 [Opitutaceae bacterium]|jgi:hypothetical protein|nr:hypothetical protein [Opitutaceae bacterium]